MYNPCKSCPVLGKEQYCDVDCLYGRLFKEVIDEGNKRENILKDIHEFLLSCVDGQSSKSKKGKIFVLSRSELEKLVAMIKSMR